ncbi:MAG: bifunctional riboflavin kinase/FAD synthetase, partial [Clostridia bacterium]|nr:bifunctional riboflavin kinase/FAD synthetase [Clostridia bacterium]
MKLIRILPGCPPPDAGKTVAALGFFDGVHIGHRRLLDRVAETAASRGLIPSVFTFSDDAIAFKPDAARLTDFREKLELFRAAGIERVYAADFPALAGLSPERFVREILIGRLNVSVAVCGFNFRFGARAAGDSEALVRLMRAAGGEA